MKIIISIVYTIFFMIFGKVMAQRWGEITAKGCIRNCQRMHSGRLWDIPWFMSWERACNSMAATVNKQYFSRPTRCINTGIGGMWGEFDLSDDSCCARWGNIFSIRCVSYTHRMYSGLLNNIIGDWQSACNSMSATVNGVFFSKPTRCINTGTAMRGEFDVEDSSCKLYWGLITSKNCISYTHRTYSGILYNIIGDWQSACNSMSATVNGIFFPKPTRCINTGTAMWGEFDVADSSCKLYWDISAKHCISNTHRLYSGILKNIIGDWEEACSKASETIYGQFFPKPTRCIKTITAMWGEFEVQDGSCNLYWEDIKPKACITNTHRMHSGLLMNIVAENVDDGLKVCNSMPAVVSGISFTKPSRCINSGQDVFDKKIMRIWGEFDIPDNSCNLYWDEFKISNEKCFNITHIIYTAYLNRVLGTIYDDLWKKSCYSMNATINGVFYARPNNCINTGSLYPVVYGEFYFPDQFCTPEIRSNVWLGNEYYKARSRSIESCFLECFLKEKSCVAVSYKKVFDDDGDVVCYYHKDGFSSGVGDRFFSYFIKPENADAYFYKRLNNHYFSKMYTSGYSCFIDCQKDPNCKAISFNNQSVGEINCFFYNSKLNLVDDKNWITYGVKNRV